MEKGGTGQITTGHLKERARINTEVTRIARKGAFR
jgi:hypothetical protein